MLAKLIFYSLLTQFNLHSRFASEQGRHLKEGGEPNYEEAELVVHLSASLCAYLAKKNFSKDEL